MLSTAFGCSISFAVAMLPGLIDGGGISSAFGLDFSGILFEILECGMRSGHV